MQNNKSHSDPLGMIAFDLVETCDVTSLLKYPVSVDK